MKTTTLIHAANLVLSELLEVSENEAFREALRVALHHSHEAWEIARDAEDAEKKEAA